MYTVCSIRRTVMRVRLRCADAARRLRLGGKFYWGPFVLISYLFFCKKSTFLKALLIGRGGPVRLCSFSIVSKWSVCNLVVGICFGQFRSIVAAAFNYCTWLVVGRCLWEERAVAGRPPAERSRHEILNISSVNRKWMPVEYAVWLYRIIDIKFKSRFYGR